jgi:hypothetical protein
LTIFSKSASAGLLFTGAAYFYRGLIEIGALFRDTPPLNKQPHKKKETVPLKDHIPAQNSFFRYHMPGSFFLVFAHRNGYLLVIIPTCRTRPMRLLIFMAFRAFHQNRRGHFQNLRPSGAILGF